VHSTPIATHKLHQFIDRFSVFTSVEFGSMHVVVQGEYVPYGKVLPER